MGIFSKLALVVVVVVLTACGGGGGSAGVNVLTGAGGATTTTSSVTTPTATVSVSDLVVSIDKTSLRNIGTEQAVLSVTALDTSRNVMEGVGVSVRVDSGAIFTGSGKPVTSADGTFIGYITSPSDKSDRTITVVVSSNSLVRTVTLPVVGSQIAMTAVPGAPNVGQSVTLNLKLGDAINNGLSGKTLTLSGSAGLSGSVVTDFSGNAVFVGTAPSTAGTYTVTISGSGISVNKAITVLDPKSGNVVPDAIPPIGTPKLTANPNSILPNLSTSTNYRSQLKFLITNGNNQGVPNVRVVFSIVSNLGNGEAMSTGSSVVYTDSNGEVSSDYIPGTRSSPTNGVRIKACYGLSNAAVEACNTAVFSDLTVAGNPLNLSLFTDNTISKTGPGGIFYSKIIGVQVVDAAGNPVPGARISASVDITHYFKRATWSSNAYFPISGEIRQGDYIPTIIDTYTSTLSITEPGTTTVPPFASANPAGSTITVNFGVWCMNEDLSRNGILDPGEDINNNGSLQPRASDVSIVAQAYNSAPPGVTDVSGLAQLQVTWGQNVARWLAFTVKATTNVAGSEGTNSKAFVTSAAQDDVSNGTFLRPPYGSKGCFAPD